MKITERGWMGHYFRASECRFRRNTLIEYNNIKIVVSSVGLLWDEKTGKFEKLDGCSRYFETMAFHANTHDSRYRDSNVRRQVFFESPWCIKKLDADDKANSMHETVVAEIKRKLEKGERFEN